MNDKKTGELLKRLRLERGETITQVADAIGVSAMSVSYYENGERRPSDAIKIKLADHFKKPVTIFYP